MFAAQDTEIVEKSGTPSGPPGKAGLVSIPLTFFTSTLPTLNEPVFDDGTVIATGFAAATLLVCEIAIDSSPAA